jgi:hypothetical protein
MDIRPVVGTQYTCAPINGAAHVNAATLFCATLFEKQAQEIWGRQAGALQNIFNPDTDIGKVYGKSKDDVALMDGKFAINEMPKREEKYSKILGWVK